MTLHEPRTFTYHPHTVHTISLVVQSAVSYILLHLPPSLPLSPQYQRRRSPLKIFFQSANMENALRELKRFLVIWSVFGLLCVLLLSSIFSNQVGCDLKDATCDETLGESPRPRLIYMTEHWSEAALAVIITLPCFTAPFMLAEFLQTKRIRCHAFFQPPAGETITNLHFGKFLSALFMGFCHDGR